MRDQTFVVRTLRPDELRLSQSLRAQVYGWEKQWIPPCRLVNDGQDELEVDPMFDPIAIHGGAFLESDEDNLVGTFRLLPRVGHPMLPVEAHYKKGIPEGQVAVELSRLAVLEEFRWSIAMIGLCRWIYGVAMDLGATHMYALMEFGLIKVLLNYGFPFNVLEGPYRAYKYSDDFVTVCAVNEIVPSLAEADKNRRRQLAPLFAEPFDGLLHRSMLYPDSNFEKEVA